MNKFFILSNLLFIRHYTTWFTLVPAPPRWAWHNIKRRRQWAYVLIAIEISQHLYKFLYISMLVTPVLVAAIPHLPQEGTFQQYRQTQGLQWTSRLRLDIAYSWRWSYMCVIGNVTAMLYLSLAMATCAENVHATFFYPLVITSTTSRIRMALVAIEFPKWRPSFHHPDDYSSLYFWHPSYFIRHHIAAFLTEDYHMQCCQRQIFFNSISLLSCCKTKNLLRNALRTFTREI